MNATALAREMARVSPIPSDLGQVVLVLQGGGALGAYQAGVFEALTEAGVEPDWVIGTSIGAINAALIAGNRPRDRLPAMRTFWHQVTRKGAWASLLGMVPGAPSPSYLQTIFGGLDGFFRPNPFAFLGTLLPLGSESAGYYSTDPLRQTLHELIDPKLLNCGAPRLTVGAAEVRTSRLVYFDSRGQHPRTLGIDHILASGALPPAFPAVRIDGELYWDGGVLSNTPTEAIFDDHPRRNSVIFAVHLWNPLGDEPETIWDVLNRQKDIQYSSRVGNQIERQIQLHRLRHVIRELAGQIPGERCEDAAVKELLGYGCQTRMHIIRLLAPRLEREDQTKDVDFSAEGIEARWQAGLADTRAALARRPWEEPFDPLDGIVLHEPPGPEAAGLDAVANVHEPGASPQSAT